MDAGEWTNARRHDAAGMRLTGSHEGRVTTPLTPMTQAREGETEVVESEFGNCSHRQWVQITSRFDLAMALISCG